MTAGLSTAQAVNAYSYLSHLECGRCKKQYGAEALHGTCECGSPLLARYDLNGAKTALTPRALSSRPCRLWRYHELLPVRAETNVVSLGEAMTPLLELNRLAEESGVRALHLKDEGALPTGTFKARGAAVGVSRACELGARRIAMPTNGNAGSAWAAYAARAGRECLVLMPRAAQSICAIECTVAGAHLGVVNGTLSHAAAIIRKLSAESDWYDVTTLREPYRIEGKKTIGYEIFEQFGWRVPDVILCPCGGGVAIIGIHKALAECKAVGLLQEKKVPRLVAVQSTACAPIPRAWAKRSSEAEEWTNPGTTLAFGTLVPKPLGDFLILEALYDTDGCAVAVDEQEIIAAQRAIGSREGVFVCPEGAATFAACKRLRADGWIRPTDEVVLLSTGTGLKYPNSVSEAPPVIDVDNPGRILDLWTR